MREFLGVLLVLIAVCPSSARALDEALPWDVGLSIPDDAGYLVLLGATSNVPMKIAHVPVSGIFRDTARKSPAKPRARAAFGNALIARGQYREALDEFRAEYQLSFQAGLSDHDVRIARLNAQLNTAHILSTIGKDAEAEELLRRAWLDYPAFPGFAVSLSFYALERDHLNEAIAITTDGISGLELYPGTEAFFAGKLYLNRGSAYLLSGECARAMADFAKARRYPDIPETPICEQEKS